MHGKSFPHWFGACDAGQIHDRPTKAQKRIFRSFQPMIFSLLDKKWLNSMDRNKVYYVSFIFGFYLI